MQKTAADILQALDAFRRKYYKNLALRGALFAVGIGGGLFLAAVLLEHFGWLSPLGRGLLFWGGLAAVAAVTGWLVVRPLLKMQGLGKRLSRAEAAQIVGRHFPEVGDRLLNLLQLLDAGEADDGQSDLLLAAIEQKSAQLRPVPMLNAVDLGANRRYLKYALPPLVAIGLLLLLAPRTVTEPTRRIAHYNTVYERPAPFAFRVLNDPLAARQGDDCEVRVVTEGEARPAEAWLRLGDRRYRLQGGDTLRYVFHSLHASQTFVLEGGGVTSRPYTLTVSPNPQVVSFRMALSYPAYTGRAAEVLAGLGDAAVPEGTQVRWLLQTQDADSLHFEADSGRWRMALAVDGNGRAEVQRRVMASVDYAFCVSRAGAATSDTLRYALTAVADAAPQISVEEVVDSLHPDRRLFRGRVKDDYGLSGLVFVHRLANPADTARNALSEAEIALGEGAAQEFYFSFNMAELVLAPGDELSYWFEVSDNDAIHGPKTTRSRQFELRMPAADELDSLLASGNEAVRQSADRQMEALRDMQQEINDLMQRLVDKKELGWQEKKELEQLAEKQRQVRQMMQQMQQQIRENNRMEQRFREQSEQLMEKQRELDRLMQEVMDDKMKETLAEIERMMQEVDKKQVQQQLEQMKIDNAELEKQIDQNIELMKRLELEKRVEETTRRLDQLAERQRDVSRETEQAQSKDKESLMQKQQELNEEYGRLQEEMKSIEQQYKELDPSTGFKLPTDLQRQVEQEQQGAQQQLQRGKNKDASQMQREAADDMERLSEALAEAQTQAEQEDLAEDAEQVRQLLKNLVRLSMNQEELIRDVGTIYIQDPRYQSVIVRQGRLKEDFRSIDDSLQALARRQLQVASAIGKNVGEVNSSIASSLNGLLDMNQSFYGNYRNTQASRPMQYSMTALNNLALVLAESLDNMQGQMRQNSKKMKAGQCKNPGKGQGKSGKQGKGQSKASAQTMRQLQQELNRQMEALRKQLEEQGKGSKPGRHQLGQGQQMSEELARMAAQQEAIRRMMQQYGQEMKEASGGYPKLAREIDQMMRQMEQTETELVNRTITRQTMQRQQQIMTRLLEHERAEMQREREERRESHEGSELYSQPSPEELQRYERQRQSGMDQLHTVPPSLAPYYRNKVNDYFFRQ